MDCLLTVLRGERSIGIQWIVKFWVRVSLEAVKSCLLKIKSTPQSNRLKKMGRFWAENS